VMAFVWLRREDCESGNLPDLCLRCGRPTTERVERDFRTTLVWRNPLAFFSDAERWTVPVPLCPRHRHPRRPPARVPAAPWAAITLTPCAWLGAVVAPDARDFLSSLISDGLERALVMLCVWSWVLLLILLFVLGPRGIHATVIRENGIALFNASPTFANTYE